MKMIVKIWMNWFTVVFFAALIFEGIKKSDSWQIATSIAAMSFFLGAFSTIFVVNWFLRKRLGES